MQVVSGSTYQWKPKESIQESSRINQNIMRSSIHCDFELGLPESMEERDELKKPVTTAEYRRANKRSLLDSCWLRWQCYWRPKTRGDPGQRAQGISQVAAQIKCKWVWRRSSIPCEANTCSTKMTGKESKVCGSLWSLGLDYTCRYL